MPAISGLASTAWFLVWQLGVSPWQSKILKPIVAAQKAACTEGKVQMGGKAPVGYQEDICLCQGAVGTRRSVSCMAPLLVQPVQPFSSTPQERLQSE